jgi:hypothetical protein
MKHFSELNNEELRERVEKIQRAQKDALKVFNQEGKSEVHNQNQSPVGGVGQHAQNDRIVWHDCRNCGHKLPDYEKTCGACQQAQ